MCLPDAAAIEAVSLVENENVTIIDASTAHRTSPGWAYGFPELSENSGKISETARELPILAAMLQDLFHLLIRL